MDFADEKQRVFWGSETDDPYECAKHALPLSGHDRNRLGRFET
jgi:hypothetical protein